MTEGKLTPAQVEVLEVLAGMAPTWKLTGGAALAGFHTRHRETRDLDIFWGCKELGDLDIQISRRLSEAGFAVAVLQRHPAFCRLRVSRGPNVVVLDLVADPVTTVAEPTEHAIGRARILVDQPHDILVNKLCALLSRSELRDLEDIRALLHAGGDLVRAMSDAPRKDAGFSPLTFAWVLEQLPIAYMGRALGRSDGDIRGLEEFRTKLVEHVLALSRPG